jgi:predicted ester cyclase
MDKLKLFWRLLCGLLLQGPRQLNFAQAYLAAWNRHDRDRVVALTGGGSYSDPLSKGALGGAQLRQHADALITAFPDLSFELGDAISVGHGVVAAQYLLSGTHTGPLPGAFGIEQIAATGRRILLPGTIFLRFDDAGQVQVSNSFDLEQLAQQLEFIALLMPREMANYQFGAFYRYNLGNDTPPDAIGITWLQVRGGEAAFEHSARITNQVLQSFASRPGFVTGIIGARPPDAQGHSSGFTMSAWESLEALEANLLPNPEHQAVVHQFMKEGLAYATHSRVYQLVRAKPVMIACAGCGKKNNAHKTLRICSQCGAALEAAPAYW